jgi:hypothetical protein
MANTELQIEGGLKQPRRQKLMRPFYTAPFEPQINAKSYLFALAVTLDE